MRQLTEKEKEEYNALTANMEQMVLFPGNVELIEGSEQDHLDNKYPSQT